MAAVSKARTATVYAHQVPRAGAVQERLHRRSKNHLENFEEVVKWCNRRARDNDLAIVVGHLKSEFQEVISDTFRRD